MLWAWGKGQSPDDHKLWIMFHLVPSPCDLNPCLSVCVGQDWANSSGQLVMPAGPLSNLQSIAFSVHRINNLFYGILHIGLVFLN